MLAEHIRHLDRSRFTPLVACTAVVPELVELYRDAGASVHLTPLPRLRGKGPFALVELLRGALSLRHLIRRERVDIVVSNTSRAAYFSTVALLGSVVPLVWWVRDFLYGRRIFRLLGRRADRIICVSRAIRDYYGGAGDERFEVIYVGNSIYRELEHVTAATVRAERECWGLEPDDVVIGFMGRLVADKGIEDLITAVEEVHRTDPRVRLLVVGTGSNQEGAVEEKIRAEVRDRSLSFVRFAGYQSEQALYYRLFDVFVLATRTGEPFATSVVQAMMAGTPVIGTDSGGTSEIVVDRETGLLVPPSSPAEMAAAIRDLLEDAELRSHLGIAGQDYSMEHNREELTTARAEALYDQLGSGTSGPDSAADLPTRETARSRLA